MRSSGAEAHHPPLGKRRNLELRAKQKRGSAPPSATLVLLALLLALALGRLGADLLVVLLEGGEVLAGLWVCGEGSA